MNESMILRIDRSLRFDPKVLFEDDRWSVWRGPLDGDGLIGEEKQDARSLALGVLGLDTIKFSDYLEPGEYPWMEANERLLRVFESGSIRLDAQIGQALLEEPDHQCLNWIYFASGIDSFELPGTVLRDAYGEPCLLYIARLSPGFWCGLPAPLKSWNHVWSATY